MSDVTGYYYLHTNGDLVFKKVYPDVFDSNVVLRVWPFIADNRTCAWAICIEALALGVQESRIKELQEKWHLTNEDAVEFATRAGMRVYMDGDAWCATFVDFENLQESPAGLGDDALHALAALIREVGSPVLELIRQVQGGTS